VVMLTAELFMLPLCILQCANSSMNVSAVNITTLLPVKALCVTDAEGTEATGMLGSGGWGVGACLRWRCHRATVCVCCSWGTGATGVRTREPGLPCLSALGMGGLFFTGGDQYGHQYAVTRLAVLPADNGVGVMRVYAHICEGRGVQGGLLPWPEELRKQFNRWVGRHRANQAPSLSTWPQTWW